MLRNLARRSAPFALAAGLGLGFLGCDDDAATAGEQFDQALEQGEDALEQGNAALDEMKEEGAKAEEQVKELSAQAKDLAQQQVTLMKEQLDSFGDRISKLPAEQERAFSNRLAELRAMTGEAEAALNQYAGKAGAAWEPVQEKLDSVKSKFDAFANDLSEARP